MQFGKVEDEIDLDAINFKLPPDHPDNESILSKSELKSFEVYVGCAKWVRLFPPLHSLMKSKI